ncbi:hypothetical protein J6590_014268 [Homalodisca vitripennis]|nr:hypothetical protein J6590_014268 [Homalodisca vitripennis]
MPGGGGGLVSIPTPAATMHLSSEIRYQEEDPVPWWGWPLTVITGHEGEEGVNGRLAMCLVPIVDSGGYNIGCELAIPAVTDSLLQRRGRSQGGPPPSTPCGRLSHPLLSLITIISHPIDFFFEPTV